MMSELREWSPVWFHGPSAGVRSEDLTRGKTEAVWWTWMGEGSKSAQSPGLPSVPVPVLSCLQEQTEEMECVGSSVRSLEMPSRTSKTCSWIVPGISRQQEFQCRCWKEALGKRINPLM